MIQGRLMLIIQGETHADDPRVTQYAVLCSEVLCKVR